MSTKPRRSQPRPSAKPVASGPKRPARPAVLPVDAEDIALARLQAHLRQREGIQATRRLEDHAVRRRTSVGLPSTLLDKARQRASRDDVTLSEVVRAALEHYLRSH